MSRKAPLLVALLLLAGNSGLAQTPYICRSPAVASGTTGPCSPWPGAWRIDLPADTDLVLRPSGVFETFGTVADDDLIRTCNGQPGDDPVACNASGEQNVRAGDYRTIPVPPPPIGEGYVMLRWDAPMFSEDGTDLLDLAGFRIHWGIASGIYTDATPDLGNVEEHLLGPLPAGIYFIAATAHDFSGNVSAFSNQITVEVKPGETVAPGRPLLDGGIVLEGCFIQSGALICDVQ